MTEEPIGEMKRISDEYFRYYMLELLTRWGMSEMQAKVAAETSLKKISHDINEGLYSMVEDIYVNATGEE